MKPATNKSQSMAKARPRDTAAELGAGSGCILLRRVAAVMVQKIPIDRFAAAEAFIHAVPILNRAFAKLPAEVHFAAAKDGGKIDQADVQIFDDAAYFLYLLDRVTQLRRGLVTPGARGYGLGAVHQHAAGRHNTLGKRLKPALGVGVI